MPLPRDLIETTLISTLFQITTVLIIGEHLINGVNSFKTFKLKSQNLSGILIADDEQSSAVQRISTPTIPN